MLAEGGTWQSVETAWQLPEAGQPIRIVRASLGGYRARIGSARQILVKRVR